MSEAVEHSPKCLLPDAVGDNGGTNWHVAAAEGFGKTHDVGLNPFMLGGEQPTRTTETGLDFIEDKQGSELLAESLGFLEISRWMEKNTTLAQNRFDNEARHVSMAQPSF